MIALKKVYFSIFFLSQLLINFSLLAQEEAIQDSIKEVELDYIRWVSEFPTNEKDEEKGIIKRLNEFFFGKKTKVLVKPVSIVAENPGKYWILDQKSSSIVFVEKNKGELVKIKPYDELFLSSMVGICIVPHSGLIFTDSRLNKVFFLEDGSTGLVIMGDSINWQQPTGVAHSIVNDETWVIETRAHRISIIDSHGDLKRIIGNRGSKPGEFNFPTHIWIDSEGFAYVVDAMNFRVQIFNSSGEFVSMFGEAGDGTGFFARPKGIATDSYGNIYVVDALFHSVQIFNREGQLLHYFGNQGREKGNFWMPTGIFIDQDDNIYVADTYNSRIQVFKLINAD
jgi:NHL repeat/6-bladed beta-propeller